MFFFGSCVTDYLATYTWFGNKGKKKKRIQREFLWAMKCYGSVELGDRRNGVWSHHHHHHHHGIKIQVILEMTRVYGIHMSAQLCHSRKEIERHMIERSGSCPQKE